MSDREIEQYVAGLAGGVPHVDAPLGAVLAAGRAAAGRRRRRLGAGLVAATAAAVAAVLLGPQLVVQQAPIEVLLSEEPAAVLSVPDGMRLVGAEGVAIAVPEEWVSVSSVEARCSKPTSDHVYLVSSEFPNIFCTLPAPVSEPRSPLQSVEIATDGEERYRDDSGCDADGCYRVWRAGSVTFSAYLVAADRELLRSELEAMGDTIQTLPNGYTTVPEWPNVSSPGGPADKSFGPILVEDYVQLVEDAGLVVTERADSEIPYPLAVVPGFGSVVPVGSEVGVSQE